MKNRLNAIAQPITDKMPKLGEELGDAGIVEGPVEYVSAALAKASMMALLAFAGSAIALAAKNKANPALSAALAVFAFAFILLLYVMRPRQLMKSRARRIEQSLVYSLHAIKVEMASGIKFSQAIEDVSERNYGEFSREMKWVVEEAHKRGLKEALEHSARRNPSRIYRRTVWQLTNSLETGADIHSNLKSIIDDLRRAQESEAHRYGRALEKQMTFYVMGAIVFPALAVVLVQTASSLGISERLGGEGAYWVILAISLIVQLVFIYLIRFRKPSLLGTTITEAKTRRNPIGHIKEILNYAGVDMPWFTYVASRLLLCLALGILLTILLKPHTSLSTTTLLMVTTSAAAITAYTRLLYMGDKIGVKAAEYLPDALRTMASNMQAGIAIDQALFMSARKEFGILGCEIQKMATDMMKNMTFEEALDRLKSRIRSEPLHLSVNLIGHGLKAGHGLSESLLHIADILQEKEHVRRAVETQMESIKTTVLLLVMVSAPILYSCTMVAGTVMPQLNAKLGRTIPQEVLMQSWIHPGKSVVTPEFLNQYIMVSLFSTAVLGSVIMGEATSGRVTDGLRYALIMALTSLTIYIAAKAVLISRIGGVFT